MHLLMKGVTDCDGNGDEWKVEVEDSRPQGLT